MGNVNRLKNRARREEQRENWDAAIELYTRALRESERDRDTAADLSLYNRIGDIHLRRGDAAAAVRIYETAIQRYSAQELHASAIALCNKVLRVMPTRAETYRRLGQLRLATGLVADARANYLRHATEMVKRDRAADAVEALEEFVAWTADPEATERLAEALRLAEDERAALRRLERLRGILVRGGKPTADVDWRIDELRMRLGEEPAAREAVEGSAWTEEEAELQEADPLAEFDAQIRALERGAVPGAGEASSPGDEEASADEAPPAAEVPGAAEAVDEETKVVEEITAAEEDSAAEEIPTAEADAPVEEVPAAEEAVGASGIEEAEEAPVPGVAAAIARWSFSAEPPEGPVEVDGAVPTRAERGAGRGRRPQADGRSVRPTGPERPEGDDRPREEPGPITLPAEGSEPRPERARLPRASATGPAPEGPETGTAFRDSVRSRLAIRPAGGARAWDRGGSSAPGEGLPAWLDARESSVGLVVAGGVAPPAPRPEGTEPWVRSVPEWRREPAGADAVEAISPAPTAEASLRPAPEPSEERDARPAAGTSDPRPEAREVSERTGHGRGDRDRRDRAPGPPAGGRRNGSPLAAESVEVDAGPAGSVAAPDGSETGADDPPSDHYRRGLELGEAGDLEGAIRELERATRDPACFLEAYRSLEGFRRQLAEPDAAATGDEAAGAEVSREAVSEPEPPGTDPSGADADAVGARGPVDAASSPEDRPDAAPTVTEDAVPAAAGDAVPAAERDTPPAARDAVSPAASAGAIPSEAGAEATDEPVAPPVVRPPAADPGGGHIDPGFVTWLRSASPELLDRTSVELERRGEVRKALLVVERLLRLDADDADLHRRRIALITEAGDEDALRHAYLELGQCLERAGDRTEARAAYAVILDLDPENPVARAAVAALEEEDVEIEARRRLERETGAADAPETTDAAAAETRGRTPLSGIGDAATDDRIPTAEPGPGAGQGGIAGEASDVTEPAHTGSGAPRPYDRVDQNRIRGVDFDVILSDLKEQLAEGAVDPNAAARTELGERLMRMGLVDEAIRELQAAVRAPDAPPRAFERLGEAFIEKGQPRVAARLLAAAVDSLDVGERHLLGILYQLGVAYQEVGNAGAALECYERIFSIDIDYRDIQERIAACSV